MSEAEAMATEDNRRRYGTGAAWSRGLHAWLARTRTVALLALAALLALPLQAEAQTEEWSASITTGSLSTLIGVWPDRSPAVGSMTDRDFDYDGSTYTFSHIRVSSAGGLQISMTAAFSQTALDNLTFQAGSSSFALSDATTSDSKAMNWNSAGLSWSSGQTIAVKMVSGGTTLSTDATLSDLDLADAADGSAIDLNETFAAATKSYTAGVANSIDEITVEPASDNNATFAYLDDSDMALTDADTNKAGFQVDLSEGANTVKEKVTAEDGAATDTYTVVVTRAAMTIPPPSGTALVSNLVQTSGGIGSLNSYDQAQAFTTGDNFGGYALTSVEIQTTGTPTLSALTVSIRSDSSGSPDASLGTLMNSAAVASDGIATFTASGAGIDLESETTYFVMVDVSASDPSGNIQNTASDAEDPGKAANWSIGDTSLYRNKGSNGSWTSFADSKKIRVNGAAKAGVGSTDADLTGLALKDAADDSTVTLSPGFATATKAYTADVANDVAAVTVEPALSDSNATVAYLDASDTVLTDADTNTTGFQTALLVGETTIKVKVTAEDDLTTETYTVVVTRTAATGTTVVTIAADAPTAIYNEIGASFTVTRTGATTNPLDVVVALTQTRLFLDAGDLLKTVTIAAGSSSKTLSFSAGDLLLPASETRESGTLTATAQAGTGYNPGTTATASVDVVVALTVSFDELSYSVDEGVGMLQVMLVARTGVGAPAPASAWFSVSSAELNPPEAISSEDYGSLSVTVQIPASAYVADGNVFRAEVPVEVEILDDARDEPDERFHLQLQITPGLLRRYSNFTDADGVVCRNPICGMPITIEDNDAPPTVTLVLSPDSITENGGLSQITATLDHPSSEQTSIDISATAVPPLAVADDFFMPPSRRLSIPIGETQSVSTGHVVVLAIDNYVYSGNKSVTISGTASNDMGIVQPQAQTLTIEDDESGPATDATLSGLALKIAEDDSTIALSPGFAPGTTSYTAIVGVGVDTITVEPTENDSNATVAYLDGSDTALTDTDVYKARFQAALAEGANTIKVKVTAADRSTIQTYTVTVTRATAATDADLTGLALKNAADDSAVTLSPGFATATKSYTALVANNVLSITVESAKSDSNAAVAYLDFADAARVDADPIKPGFQVALGLGPNTINVQVTAEDGHTTDTYTVVVTRESNTDATGQPAIAGAAQVGRTLTAELGTIADIDGLPDNFPRDYDFQWVRVDADGMETDIFVATSNTYTPLAADVGKKVKVKVSFTADDGSVVEGPLPSDATAPVVPDAASCGGSAVWCSTLTVEHGTPDVDGEFQVGLATNLGTPPESFGSLVGATFTHLGTGYTVTQIFALDASLFFATSPNLPDDGAGLTLHIQRLSGALELKLNDRDSYDILAALPTGTKVWSFASVLATGSANPPLLRGFANPNGDYRQETDEGTLLAVSLFHENRDAEGTPTISGTAQVGETLTAGIGDIADADGLPGTFPDDYTFQWVRRDGGTDSPITGATASTYTPVAADVGKKVKVTVDFTDDGGTGEARTSNAYPSSGTIVSETLPELSFAPNTVTVNEDAVSATLTVELDPASTGTVTVDYATRDEVGAAKAGEDYTATSGTLTFAATETSKTITVPILNDDAYENNESFHVDLTNPTGATLPDPPSATVGIVSEDAVPTASMADVTVDEGAGTMTLTLRLSHPSDAEIAYFTIYDEDVETGTATEGDDYDDFLLGPGRTARITVPAGDLSQTFDITIVNDSEDEPDETIIIVWNKDSNSDATPASITFTGTITDNDTAGVTVSKTVLTVTEQDTTGDSYTVVLDSQPTANVVVTVAGHAGTDVLPTPTTLTFTSMNWETAQTVTAKAVNDANTVNETVSLTHAATSTDTDYDGITINGVTVMVEDNDTAQVTGVVLTPGDGELAVAWAPLANATGYEVQWKSGGQSYNNSGRQATISSGSTASHTIPSLTNGTTYTVRMRATRTGANAGPYSDEAMDAPEAAGVTVSETAVTVTEADTTGDSYTVVLDSQPTANVVVTVAGHAGTDVLPTPTTLTFTPMNWETVQTVTVKAVNDTNTVDETVSLTHAATSTDTDYDGITINGVTVMVEDNDTAQVTGVVLTPGDGELAVAWAPLANATGYEVQWKSGGQSYNNSGRQATISSGSTASHTIPSLTNGTTYTVRMRATRTGANAGPYSDEAMDAPQAAGVTVSETALTVSEADTTGDSYTVVLDSEPAASVTVTVAGHASTSVNPTPTSLTFTTMNWDTAQTVTVKAVNDTNTVDETVSLTHAATSTDTDYDGITIAGVTVMVEDNDTAQVTGVVLTPGDGELAVEWVPLANATGYEVQWKSGGQSYNNSGRQATISSGSTASHTIPSLTNGTTYTVRMRATRTGANAGPYSDEAMDAPEAAVTPTVSISADKTSAVFREDDITFTLTRTGPTTEALDVSLFLPQEKVFLLVADLTKTVTIAAGQSTKTFTVAASSFQHFAAGTPVEGGTLGATVDDVDGPGGDYDRGTTFSVDVDIVIGVMVRFDMASYTVGEAGTLSYKLIARTGPGAPQPSSATSIIEVVSEDGTASINTDFAFVNFDKAFTAANFSADGGVWKAEEPYTVSITNDALAEDDETFNLTIRHAPGAVSYSLVDASGNSCGTECEVTVTITDDDTAGVTVSKTVLTVTEQDTTGDSYTVVLDSQPTANVVVTVAGHSGTDVLPTPTTLTFTPINWETVQTVTVTAVNDADTTNDTVSLTHSAASTDTDYDGITINGVTVMVEDNDTAQVTGVVLTPGDGELAVAWAPLANATGYEVQWKSGGQSYNTSDRQATISSGSTASHTIPSLTNGTTYTVRMRATRTGANAGPYSDEAMDAPQAAGVTVSETAVTMTEADTTGDSYTVVLDSEPTANVVVTVAGHSGTDVLPTPTTLTFTPINWETVQTVTVTAVNDADTTNDTVSLTHSAASTDTDYDGITINGVTVMVEDNDTAQVTGVVLTPGDGELAVAWAPLANATGYEVQWKSGGQSYNTSDRQATISSGSTASHTIPSLTNGTTYTVRMRATRTGANAGPYSDEAMDAPQAAGVTVSETAVTMTEADTTGDSYTVVLDSQPTANVVVTVAGHSGTDVLPTPTTLTFTPINWETVQTVTVKAVNDANTVDETVSLTHAATSTDTDYDGITINGVTVMVEDNDTAKVTGVVLTPGDGELAVAWAPLANATGYEVQWKSGGQSYNNSGRQATISSGSTVSHTIPSLTNGTTYTVRMRATRTGANAGPYSDEAMDAPEAAAVPPVTLSIADASAFENAGHLLFDVTLSRSLPNTVKVDFETISGGTATEGVDYHARRTYTHVIPGRETTVQMGFALIEDTDNDAGETVKVRLSNARVVDAYGNVKMVLNITNAEATGTITAPATTTTNVPGLTIGIQDATGDEDDGWLDFRVRLSRNSDDLVCYDFETISGGTAEEGTDYLKIPKASYWMHIGKRVDTLLVRIIDDSVNDNGETVKVKISNARLCDDASQTVSITRDEATGTIRNTDPMPQAWLARFGRTAADHVVQAVEDRWQGEPRASHLTLGGRQAGDLFGWTGLAGPGDREKTENRDDPVGTDPSSMGWLAPSGGTDAGIGATVPGMTLGLGDMNTAPGGPGGVEREAGKTLSGRAAQGALLRALGLPDPRAVPDLRTLLMGSSFFYSAALDEDGQNRSSGRTRLPEWLGEWSAWGRTASSRFSGADGNLALDGEVATAMLGFDSRWDRWLAGVAISFSEGRGAYSHPTASGGAVASTMTGLNPYARFELNERTSFWGVLGYGVGDLSLTPARSDTALGTELANAMAAFGGRTALSVRTGEAGRFELALRSDARLTNTVSESIEGMVGTAGQTGRVRLMLEGSGSMRLATGGVLKPKLEAGLRYDTGDAETGAGLEVGGGLGYAAGQLSVEVNARGLLAHRDTEYEEWGLSGSIAYTPGKDGRGLSMRLGSAWGATQSGVESLWSRQDASGLVSNAAFEAAQRYQVELRYGLDGKKGRARWEPFVGVESGEGASRALRLGVKLTSGRRLDVGLELGRRQGRPGADPEHAVQLHGRLHW